MTMNDASGKML